MLPVHTGFHWLLFLVKAVEKCVYVLDSLPGGIRDEVADKIVPFLEYLNLEWNAVHKVRVYIFDTRL